MWSGNAGSFIPSLASLCNRDMSLGKSLLFYSEHRRSFTAVSPYLQQIRICALCNRIHDEGGLWQKLERYIESHSEAKVCESWIRRNPVEEGLVD